MRKTISKNLLLLAESDDESQLDDFVRMFILFALNCIVFPLSTYLTHRFVFSYIDDLPNFFGYSWGDAAHRFLCDKISGHIGNSEGTIGRKTYLDGCVVGMMAWVYDKIPSLGVVIGSPRTYPRLFKWGESKIPIKVEDAETLLKKITRTKILSKMKDEETTSKIRRLEKLVEEQFHEIKILRQMCCQTGGNVTKDVVGGQIDGKVDEGKKADKNTSMEDFDTDLGGYNKVHDADVATHLIKCDDNGFTKMDMELYKVHTEVSSREVVDERDDANVVASSEEDKVGNVISSIVKNVMTRTNRVKKRKPSMFVTPPSSTPRRKPKSMVECKECPVISDEGDTSVKDEKMSADKDELKLKNYRGREDFCGCEELSEKERNIIMKYLTGEKLRTEKREFELRNSIYTAMSLGTARAYAKFLVGYMRIIFNYKEKEFVKQVFCRQQGADLNCGVYTCLWANCYARDDDEAWTYERDCKMNNVRARIAATILSDNNGVFSKDS